jgi:transposase InsO family protein
MTNNGSCYYAHRFRRGLEAFGARQIYTRPYRPQTNGKAERFIQTAIREWAHFRAYRASASRAVALTGFLNRYDCRRSHRALGNQTPLSRPEALVRNNVLVSDT